jgi:HAD superfamily hydrolase (TIGR01509 family)
MAPKHLKAAIFDFHNTLVFRGPRMAEGTDRKLLKLIGAGGATAKWLWTAREKFFHERSTGAITEEEFWELALKELGIHDLRLAQKLCRVGDSLNAYPDAAAAMKLLRKRGLKVGILANTRAGAEREAKRLFHGLADAESYSHLTGFRKPHPRAYLAICKNMGVKPQECAFISDEIYEDLWGAKRLGMLTALVRHPSGPGFFGVDPEWRAVEPDLEADTLLELAETISKQVLRRQSKSY